MNEYYLAWWNLENLFDISGSKERPDWLQTELRSELKGWNKKVLANKTGRLAEVIRFMNDGKGPDLLGVCEVENRAVLHKLIGAIGLTDRDYAVAHHESNDQRGIDIAFIYDRHKFEAGQSFHYEVLKRAATRDIFQVSFTLRSSGDELAVIGNHWPSRLGGTYETEPYRILAAETLSYWLKRILEIKGKDTPVLVMGDFNDEPHSRSLTDYARSTMSKKKVGSANTVPRILNLMWPLLGEGEASYYNSNFPLMLDQIMATRGMVNGAGPLRVIEDSVEVVRFSSMVRGSYKVPRRHGRPSRNYDPTGYSDHFPVAVKIGESE